MSLILFGKHVILFVSIGSNGPFLCGVLSWQMMSGRYNGITLFPFRLLAHETCDLIQGNFLCILEEGCFNSQGGAQYFSLPPVNIWVKIPEPGIT